MAHKKNTTNLTELLLQCVTQPDPMLSMLEWLCMHLMEAEVDQQLGAEKSQRTDGRSGYRSGYRPRRLDTRMGTMYLMVLKVRQGGLHSVLRHRAQAQRSDARTGGSGSLRAGRFHSKNGEAGT